MKNYATFLLELRVLKTDSKKDFSFSFETFHIILLNVVQDIGMMIRVFANGPGNLGSIPDRVTPKTQKMVLDASLFNTQRYKVEIKGKVEQSRKRSSALPYTSV